jgi:hypothetical protein
MFIQPVKKPQIKAILWNNDIEKEAIFIGRYETSFTVLPSSGLPDGCKRCTEGTA